LHKGKNLKLIAVDVKNYDKLKRRGYAGDSFNDVITALLYENEKMRQGQEELEKQEPVDEEAAIIPTH
jgi:predicted CopG family antitoxin